MRLEFFLDAVPGDGSELSQSLIADLGTRVYFALTSFFSDRGLSDYFQQRVASDGRTLMHIVLSRTHLLEILRRPLHLKMFCDLLYSFDRSARVKLLDIEHAAELLQRFLNSAAQHELGTPVRIPGGRWDLEALARLSRELYERGEDSISLLKLQQVVVFEDSFPDSQSRREAQFRYIHKCPFLQYCPPHGMRFAHRAFHEYLIALGIVQALESDDCEPFDEIVANVEMRKFLAFLIWNKRKNQDGDGKTLREHYADESARGNGMFVRGKWPLKQKELLADEQFWKAAEEHRRKLLYSMLDPERDHEDIMTSIKWFLKSVSLGLHPAYLMYNFEAIAVNIRYHWWARDYKVLNRTFEKILHAQLEERLGTHPESLQKSWFLLVHRILDIARRLRYRWVIPLHHKVLDWLKSSDPDRKMNGIQIRILNVCSRIEQDMGE